MAKWFKEFPTTLKNGTDRIRSVFESSQAGTKTKSGRRRNSLLSERNRKNSSSELNRSGVSSQKDGKGWDSLLPGKNRKTSKSEPVFEEQLRPTKTSASARAYISRMVRVEQQDKNPNFNQGTSTSPTVPAPEAEKPTQCKTEALIVVEDYADPFDAQRTRRQRDADRLGENDGYMEPYDAQQMITEIRRRGSKDLLKVCVLTDWGEGMMKEGQPAPLLIHDLPCEGSGDKERTTVTRPGPDRRPASEYELPLERRKEQLVRTLSAQFDKPLIDETPTRQPQHPALNLQHHLWQNIRTLKVLRSPPSSSPELEACCADPSLRLEKQSWRHSCVTHQEGGVSAAGLQRNQLPGQEQRVGQQQVLRRPQDKTELCS